MTNSNQKLLAYFVKVILMPVAIIAGIILVAVVTNVIINDRTKPRYARINTGNGGFVECQGIEPATVGKIHDLPTYGGVTVSFLEVYTTNSSGSVSIRVASPSPLTEKFSVGDLVTVRTLHIVNADGNRQIYVVASKMQ